MYTKLFVLKCFIFFIFHISSLAICSPVKLSLVQGHTRLLDLPKEGRVFLSQKGIVSLNTISDEQWQLVALRPGFVVIGVGEEHPGVAQYFIQVNPIPKRGVRYNQVFNNNICKIEGVDCNIESGVISGEFKDYGYYHRMRSACLKLINCNFIASLKKQSLANEVSKIQQDLGFSYKVIEKDNRIIITTSCSKDSRKEILSYANSLLNNRIEIGEIFFACQRSVPQNFLVFFEILQINDNHSLSKHIERDIIGNSLANSIVRNPFLKGMDATTNSRIVAQPEFVATESLPVEVHSGGEVLLNYVENVNDKSVTRKIFKEFGFKIKLNLERVGNQVLKLSYSVNISNPDHSAGNKFSGGAVSGGLFVDLGNAVKLATIDLNTHLNSNLDSSWFKDVPILSILFKKLESVSAESKLMTWVKIEEIN